MRWSAIGDSACSVARALAIVGDRWTLLVLREAFFSTRRFEDFQRLTGASPRLVANRLAKLVGEGVMEKRRYQERPARYEYRLTAKGRDLHATILVLSQWGQRWMGDPAKAPVTLTHAVPGGCGRAFRPVLVCGECGEPIRPADTHVEFSPDYAAERSCAAHPDKLRTPGAI